MFRNILEIEHEAMVAGLTEEDSVLVLFDFTAAFPSLAREYLFETLSSAQLPQSVINVVAALYLNTTASLMLHGRLHGQVRMERGIRQGCPLSPLLFALTTDTLLRALAHRHPRSTPAAFADDTALLVRNWATEGKKVFQTFRRFHRVSGLGLNYAKTVAIPLWIEPITDVERRHHLRGFPPITWADTGKYLGVYVGPGKHDKSWDRPARKFEERLGEWNWAELGLFQSIRTYNIYVLPLLTFVGQLELLPHHVQQLGERACRQLAPGGGVVCPFGSTPLEGVWAGNTS